MKTNLLTLAVLLGVIVLLVAHVWGQPWTPTRIAGVVIGVPSVALLFLARIQLGGSFSVRAKAHALITSGLYSVAILAFGIHGLESLLGVATTY